MSKKPRKRAAARRGGTPSKAAAKRSPVREVRRREEWIGGILTLPLYVREETAFKPKFALWVDFGDGAILAQRLLGAEATPSDLVDCLTDAIERPMAGSPRRPALVRVSDEACAEAIREKLELEVEVSDTPELREVADALAAAIIEDDDTRDPELPATFFEHPSITPALLDRFFRAAARLYRAQPWDSLEDTQPIKIDIPGLGVERGCLSVIGALQDQLGFVLFSSADAFRAFVEAVDEQTSPGLPAFPDARTISLGFERGAELPRELRREIVDHGWEVAAADAHPFLACPDAEGVPRPLTARDYEIATTCSESLAALFEQHGDALEGGGDEDVLEEALEIGDLEVHVTFPHPEVEWLPEGLRALADLEPIPVYDASEDRSPEDWLDLDEATRLAMAFDHHRSEPPPHAPPPQPELHAVMHAVVETQVASGKPRCARSTLARLRANDIGRHDAIHAIGGVLSRYLFESMNGAPFDEEGYARELEAIDPAAWRAQPEKRAARNSKKRGRRSGAKQGEPF